jgi:hypothetical protein
MKSRKNQTLKTKQKNETKWQELPHAFQYYHQMLMVSTPQSKDIYWWPELKSKTQGFVAYKKLISLTKKKKVGIGWKKCGREIFPSKWTQKQAGVAKFISDRL